MKNSVLVLLLITFIVASKGQSFGRQRRPQRRRQFQFPRWQPPSTGNGPSPFGTMGNRGTLTNSRNNNRQNTFRQQSGRNSNIRTQFFRPSPTNLRLYNEFGNNNHNNHNNVAVQNSTDASLLNFNQNLFHSSGNSNTGFGTPSQNQRSTLSDFSIGSNSMGFNIRRGQPPSRRRNDNQRPQVQSSFNQRQRNTNPFSRWTPEQHTLNEDSNFLLPNENSFQFYNQEQNFNRFAQNSISPYNRRIDSSIGNSRQPSGVSQTNNLLNHIYSDKSISHVSTWNQIQGKLKQTTIPTRSVRPHQNLQRPEVTTIISRNPHNKDQTILRLSVDKVPVIRNSNGASITRRRIVGTPLNERRNVNAALNSEHSIRSHDKEHNPVKVLEKTPVEHSKVMISTPFSPKHSGSEISTVKPMIDTKKKHSTKLDSATRGAHEQQSKVSAISRLSGMPFVPSRREKAPNNFFEFKINPDIFSENGQMNDGNSNSPVGLFGSFMRNSVGNTHMSDTIHHKNSDESRSETFNISHELSRANTTQYQSNKTKHVHVDKEIQNAILSTTNQKAETPKAKDSNKHIIQTTRLVSSTENNINQETQSASEGRLAVTLDKDLPIETSAFSKDSNFFKPWGELGLGDTSVFRSLGTFGAGMFGYRNTGNEPPRFKSLLNTNTHLDHSVHGGILNSERTRNNPDQFHDLFNNQQPQEVKKPQNDIRPNKDITSVSETISKKSVSKFHPSSLFGQMPSFQNTYPLRSDGNTNQQISQESKTLNPKDTGNNDHHNINQPHTLTISNTRFSHLSNEANDLLKGETFPKTIDLTHNAHNPTLLQTLDASEYVQTIHEPSRMPHSRLFLVTPELSDNKHLLAYPDHGSVSSVKTNQLNFDKILTELKQNDTIKETSSTTVINHGRLVVDDKTSHPTQQLSNAHTNFKSINSLSHSEPKQTHSQFSGTVQGFVNTPIFELNRNDNVTQSFSPIVQKSSSLTSDTKDTATYTHTSQQYVHPITDRIMSLMMNDSPAANGVASNVDHKQDSHSMSTQHSTVSINESTDDRVAGDRPHPQNDQSRILNPLLFNGDKSSFENTVFQNPISQPAYENNGDTQTQTANHLNDNTFPLFVGGLLGARDGQSRTLTINDTNQQLTQSDANLPVHNVGSRDGQTMHQNNVNQEIHHPIGKTHVQELGRLANPAVFNYQNDIHNTELNTDNVASNIPKTSASHEQINNFQPISLTGSNPASVSEGNRNIINSVPLFSPSNVDTRDKMKQHNTPFLLKTNTALGNSLPMGIADSHSVISNSYPATVLTHNNARNQIGNIQSMPLPDHTLTHPISVDNSITNLFPSKSSLTFGTVGLLHNNQAAPKAKDTPVQHKGLLSNYTLVQSISDLIDSMPSEDLNTVLQNINLNKSTLGASSNIQPYQPIVSSGVLTKNQEFVPVALDTRNTYASSGYTRLNIDAESTVPQIKIGNTKVNSKHTAAKSDQPAHDHQQQQHNTNNVVNAPYLSGFDFGIAFSNELSHHSGMEYPEHAGVPTVVPPKATTPDNTMTFLDDLLSGLKQILVPETTIPPTTTTQPPSTTPSCTSSSENFKCKGKGMFSTLGTMEAWCLSTCKTKECPENICECSCKTDSPVTVSPKKTVKKTIAKSLKQSQRPKLKKGHHKKHKRVPPKVQNRRLNNKNRKLLSSHRRRPRRTTPKPKPIPTTDEPPEIEWEDIVTTTTELPSTTQMSSTTDPYYDYGFGSTISPFVDIKLEQVEQADVTATRLHVTEIPQVAWASEIKSRLAKLAKNAMKANEPAVRKENPYESTTAPYHSTAYWEATTPTPYTTPPTREWNRDWPTPRPAERRPGSWDRRSTERRRQPPRNRDKLNDRWSRNTTPPYDTWDNNRSRYDQPTTYDPPHSRGQWNRGGWGNNDRSRGWDNRGGWGNRNRNYWGDNRSRKTTEAPDR